MADPLLIACPHCGKLNRVPSARLGEQPNCGACGQKLFTGQALAVDSAGLARHSEGDLPALVDVWAPWCGPCRTMTPMFERAAPALEPRMRLLKLNIDQAQDVARRFQIQAVPTLLLLQRGKLLARSSGVMETARIVDWARSNAGLPAA